jgi:hypothetical protein
MHGDGCADQRSATFKISARYRPQAVAGVWLGRNWRTAYTRILRQQGGGDPVHDISGIIVHAPTVEAQR